MRICSTPTRAAARGLCCSSTGGAAIRTTGPGSSLTSPANVPVPLRRSLAIVAALRPHDPLDLVLHALVQYRQPGTDREREQPLLRRLGDLDHRELHLLGQRQALLLGLGRSDLDQMYLLHGGSSCLDGHQTPVTVTTRPDKAGGPPPQLLHRAGQAPKRREPV